MLIWKDTKPCFIDDAGERIALEVILNDDPVPRAYTAGKNDPVSAELFAQAYGSNGKDGAFGPVAPFVPRPPDPHIAQKIMDDMRIMIVTSAYGGPEKRLSLNEYLNELNGHAIDGTISVDQQHDRTILQDANVWQQAMINTAAAAMTGGVSPEAVDWPLPPPLLAALAAAS